MNDIWMIVSMMVPFAEVALVCSQELLKKKSTNGL
jgi:hypothetical protein